MGKMSARTKKRAQENKNKGAANTFKLPDGAEMYKPKKGTKSIDIIPYTVTIDNHPDAEKGEQWWERTYFVHFNIGPEEKPRICPKTFGKPCPICEERKDLMREDDEANQDLIDELKPKERVLYNIIDLSDQDKGVQLMDMSYFLFGKQLDEEIREGDDEVADFAELKGGKTLKVRWAERSLGTNTFVDASRIDFKDRKDYDDDILDDSFDLDNILIVRSYEELQAELHGTEAPPEESNGKKEDKSDDDGDDDGDDDEEAKKKEEIKKERERRRAEKAAKAEKEKGDDKDKCPHGHKFGADTDDYNECDDCDLWVECDDAKEQNS